MSKIRSSLLRNTALLADLNFKGRSFKAAALTPDAITVKSFERGVSVSFQALVERDIADFEASIGDFVHRLADAANRRLGDVFAEQPQLQFDMNGMKAMTKEELIERAFDVTGGNLKDLTVEQIKNLMTVTQYVTDTCLNELEERGEPVMHMGAPMVPYMCEHWVPTILTRGYQNQQ